MSEATINRPDWMPPAMPRDGACFDTGLDSARLTKQQRRVWDAMKDGAWLTLAEVAAATGDPEASVSARIRDFRKSELGVAVKVERRRRGDPTRGLHEYRLVPR